MSRIINSLLLALLLIGVSSCKRPTPDLVEENYEFTPNATTALDRDKIKKPPVDLLTQYIYFKDNNQVRNVVIQVEEEQEKLVAPEPVKVVVATSFPVKKAFKAQVSVMTKDHYPASYTQVFMEGAKELPTTTYHLGTTELSFAVGEKQKELQITFNEEEILKLSTDDVYALPLVVSVSDDTGIIKHNYFQLTVTLQKLDKLKDMENVSWVSNFSGDYSIMPYQHIHPAATSASTHAFKVSDGKTDHNWWVKSGSQESLTLTFPKTIVKGIKITCLNRKYLSGVSLSVSNNAGTDIVSQGSVSVNGSWPTMLIEFKKPQLIDYIKFSGFQGTNSNIDIAEINLLY